MDRNFTVRQILFTVYSASIIIGLPVLLWAVTRKFVFINITLALWAVVIAVSLLLEKHHAENN